MTTTIDILWVALAFLGVGIHLGAWWEARRDWRRSVALDTGDPRTVVAVLQYRHAIIRLIVAVVTSFFPAGRLFYAPNHVTTVAGLGVIILTVAYFVSSIFELWTRASAVDAVLEAEQRALTLENLAKTKVS